MLVCAPIHYPLSEESRSTLDRAVDIATDEDAMLAVIHINLYQTDRNVTQKQLERAVRRAVDVPQHTRFVIRKGFILEEAILEAVVELDADAVVLGGEQKRGFERLTDFILPNRPSIDEFLREEYDCDCIIVDTDA